MTELLVPLSRLLYKFSKYIRDDDDITPVSLIPAILLMYVCDTYGLETTSIYLKFRTLIINPKDCSSQSGSTNQIKNKISHLKIQNKMILFDYKWTNFYYITKKNYTRLF